MVLFTRLLSKSLWRNYPFSAQFSKNPFQDIVYYSKSRCLTLWYWNGSPLNIRQKVEKFVRFGGCFFRTKKMLTFWILLIKYFGNDFSFLIKWRIWVYCCWNYRPSNFKAELKADFWLEIGIYSRKKCPRHGSGQLTPENS